MTENMQTPLESFIDYKADTGSQCGNYSIDIPKLQEGEQYRFHFDATACVGCRCCEVACNEQNNNPSDIKWRRVGEMEGGVFPAFTQLLNSMSCNHCVDPECLKGCPTESYIKIAETGIVIHEDDTCIGCQYCTWNCPYGVPVYHEERKIVTKCHMCHERLDVGQSPACVQSCPSGAIEIEAVNIKEWLERDIDTQANMPFLPDARITNSTTRYTLPENMPDEMKEMDEHILKPAHSEMPLVFMTVLTQISLGGFLALFLGDVMSLFGFESTNWIMALLVMMPAAIGLPLSALHLGRPFLALTAMKNIKTSWLSREALALGVFTSLMSVVVALYFLELPHALILALEAITLAVGIYGIYAQSMIYRIRARPSWNRRTTNMKFFGVAYVGVTMNNPQMAINIMNNLHKIGIKMSIDDFGTGYSSLSYLKKFKVYKLKIDQSFVRDITTDSEDRAIVAAIINMAHSLGLQTIAEGVETIEQLDYLREQGCDEMQGYYYSKPLLAGEFEEKYR